MFNLSCHVKTLFCLTSWRTESSMKKFNHFWMDLRFFFGDRRPWRVIGISWWSIVVHKLKYRYLSNGQGWRQQMCGLVLPIAWAVWGAADWCRCSSCGRVRRRCTGSDRCHRAATAASIWIRSWRIRDLPNRSKHPLRVNKMEERLTGRKKCAALHAISRQHLRRRTTTLIGPRGKMTLISRRVATHLSDDGRTRPKRLRGPMSSFCYSNNTQHQDAIGFVNKFIIRCRCEVRAEYCQTCYVSTMRINAFNETVMISPNVPPSQWMGGG